MEEKDKCDPKSKHVNFQSKHVSSGIFYFLGFIGAAIYYISMASGFWVGVLGFLKAIVWPVFLVLEALKFLGAG